MATPMVTRTCVITRCTLMCVDTVHGEVFNNVVEVPRSHKDMNKLLKLCKEAYGETDTKKVVSIVSTEELETLYGMTEADFIAHATVLPKRGEKEVNAKPVEE
nr:MAG TPA: hypothetical protein [Caudoviricetes sp.]